jgi:PIN domain nuclease of toxin-antitoxin system
VSHVIDDGASMSAVNLSEVVATLTDRGVPESEIHEAIDPLDLDIVEFGTAQAFQAGRLRQSTRKAGLSFGDRACLALAMATRLPVVTADRAWSSIDIGIDARIIC